MVRGRGLMLLELLLMFLQFGDHCSAFDWVGIGSTCDEAWNSCGGYTACNNQCINIAHNRGFALCGTTCGSIK